MPGSYIAGYKLFTSIFAGSAQLDHLADLSGVGDVFRYLRRDYFA